MSVTIRSATSADLEEMGRVDARNFGVEPSEVETELRSGVMDVERFRLAVDGTELVGVAGSFAFDVTLPGGATAPMGGVTWVSVSPTHRRQGIMTALMDAVRDDIDSRGEPVAMLGASEGGIYERLGYGVCTRQLHTEIDTRRATLAERYRPATQGLVRFLDEEAAHDHIVGLWERHRRLRPGGVTRSLPWHRKLIANRRGPAGAATGANYVGHPDGYAVYRVAAQWEDRRPRHQLSLLELVAVTPEAHAALWEMLLGIDLVEKIQTRCLPADDPLRYLLTDQRQVRTVSNDDGMWANVRDAATCFGARRYAVADQIVIEVDGQRYRIDGGPDGAEVAKVRSRPDVVLDHAAAGSVLFGAVALTELVAGRRASVRNAQVGRRAEAFFRWSPVAHGQTEF